MCLLMNPLDGYSTADDYQPSRTDREIKIDGLLTDEGWVGANTVPLVMRQPSYQGQVSETTEIRIAYDDQYLYISGRMLDSDPDQIRSTTLYRDEASSDDRLGIFIDSFNNNESGLHFWVNPGGVRSDEAISDDGRTFNRSWDTFWITATTRTSDGWQAEMRIPFTSLGFQVNSGDALMGIMVYREIARKNEIQIFPDINPDWPIFSSSQLQKILFQEVSNRKPVYLSPYVRGGVDKENVLNDEGEYHAQNTGDVEVGGDIRYNIKNNLTLDLTINTDFAQVEADDQQINLTRFSLFFPEKRRFFQERADIFTFPLTGNDRLFHSRRVGLQSGQPVRILGGAKLTGQIGKWDVGVLNMQTAKDGLTPSENFGAYRFRKKVLNRYSFLGGLLSNRVGSDGSYNYLYGIDGIFRVVGKEYLTVKWAQTFDDQVIAENSNNAFNKNFMTYIQWERRNLDGWEYTFTYSRAAENFTPDIGFLNRQNFGHFTWRIHQNSFPGEDNPYFRKMPFHFDGDLFFRNDDGSLQTADIDQLYALWWKNGSVIFLNLGFNIEDVRTEFSLPNETTVEADRYDFWNFSVNYTTPRTKLFGTSLFVQSGQFFDGWRSDFSLSPQWNITQSFRLSGSYIFTKVDFNQRDQGFNAHLARLRIQSALNIKLSLNAFVQYNGTSNQVSTNARFRYNFREGNDLWIVYNEGLNTERDRFLPESPQLPITQQRSLILKYTHTFRL